MLPIIRGLNKISQSTCPKTLSTNGSYFETRRYLPHCTTDEKQTEKKRVADNKCPNKLCTPPPPPPKPGFWQRFFSCDEDSSKKAKPPITTCRKRIAYNKVTPPDLSFIDGQPFRTCGEAYVVQKDLLPIKPSETSREIRLIKKIEQPLHCLLDATVDPLDKITKVELRLIALHEQKLHPSYKQLDTIPKNPGCPIDCPVHSQDPPARIYNTISGPLDPNDIPVQLKFNRDLLDKKNIMYDFKRVEPPTALIAPIIEMRKNQRPTLEKRRRFDLNEEVHIDRHMESMSAKKSGVCKKTKSASFDTLQQGGTLLNSMLQQAKNKNKKPDQKSNPKA